MPSPTLSSFQGELFNTAGGAIAGATVTVLSGQVDTVNVTNQPGSPLATIYADPYGYSEIPQVQLSLSGTASTVAGSPNVSYASGSQLSAFLIGLTITINGVQYTVLSVDPTAGTLVLATNAQSTGTFAWSATVPVSQLDAVPGFGVTDGFGNFQFWAAAGYYVLQIYSEVMPEQYVQGISVGGSGGGGGGGFITNIALETATFSALTATLHLVTTGAGNLIANLPSASGIAAAIIIIKKVDSGAGSVAVTPSSGQIDGLANFSLSEQYQYLGVISDGTNWQIFTRN
jgi:hypothetical protein